MMKFTLRELQPKDAGFMQEWMHDEDVISSLGSDFSSKTLDDALSFIEHANDSKNCKNLHLACVDETDEYLGTVSLKNIDEVNKNAEYAICFRRKAHGTGAPAFATAEILRIAFEKMQLEKVYLYLYSINKRANRFYQKQCFVLEGCQQKQAVHKGEFVDVIWYGITREMWQYEQR